MIDFKARVEYNFSSDERILLTRIRDLRSTDVYVIKPIFEKRKSLSSYDATFIPVDDFSSDTAPLISNSQFIQGVIDAAWEAGFRPTGFSDTKRETGALLNHLNDMRRIVFKDRFEAIKKTDAS